MRFTAVAWAALAVATLITCVGTLRHDYRDATLVGDQASQLMQAVSLAHGGNLSYDDADLRNYADATWRVRYREPAGLLFQRHGDGWAFAKPYGYSLVVAPFLRVLGPTHGVAVANTLLLLAVLAVCLALLRLRLRRPGGAAHRRALVLVSNVVPYAYVLYVELFTALVVGPRRLRPVAGGSRRHPLDGAARLRRDRARTRREVDARARPRAVGDRRPRAAPRAALELPAVAVGAGRVRPRGACPTWHCSDAPVDQPVRRRALRDAVAARCRSATRRRRPTATAAAAPTRR